MFDDFKIEKMIVVARNAIWYDRLTHEKCVERLMHDFALTDTWMAHNAAVAARYMLEETK